jgi:hypothetical protein
MQHEHVSGRPGERHRREILERIVLAVRVERGTRDQRRSAAEKEGVAVLGRTRHELRCYASASAAAVVYDDLLPERGTDLLGDESGYGVRAAARRIRNDEPNGLRGISLSLRRRHKRKGHEREVKAFLHGFSSILCHCGVMPESFTIFA